MMFLYNIIFTVGFLFASPYFLFKLIYSDKWREGLKMRLGFYDKTVFEKLKGQKTLWIHAASVGEVKAILPLIKKIQENLPEYHIVLTTVTRTGNRLAHELLDSSATVLYSPLDFLLAVKIAIRLIHPEAVILVESELWANMLHQLNRKKIPIALLNVRMSKRAFIRYFKAVFFVKYLMKKLSLVTAPTTREAAKMLLLGVRPSVVHIVGNLKHEKEIPPLPSQEQKMLFLKELGFDKEAVILIAGSTHLGEEEVLLRLYTQLLKKFTQLRLILAPRHPDRADQIMDLVREKKLKGSRRTQFNLGQNPSVMVDSHQVLVLDTIGELEKVYALGDIIFIGKSLLRGGGQNFLEPAQFGKSIVFGSHMENFEDMADAFVKGSAAIQVKDEKELGEVLERLLENPSERKSLGEKAIKILLSQRGALDKNFKLIQSLLNKVK